MAGRVQPGPVQQEEGGGLGRIFRFALQGMALAFLASRFLGGGTSARHGNATNSSAAEVVTAHAPVPAPTAAADPGSAGQPSLFDLITNQGYKKLEHSSLAAYEEHRKAALTASGQASGLFPLWPPGTEFTLAVFLSDSADPVTDFSALESADQGTSSGTQAATTRTHSKRSWGTFARDAFRSDSNLIKLFGTAPAVEYENATWSGLEQVQPQSASALVEADAGGSVNGNLGVLPEPQATREHAAPALWVQRGLRFDGTSAHYRQQSLNITVPAWLRAAPNATVFAHMYFIAAGHTPDPASPTYWPAGSFHVVHPLIKHLARKPARRVRSLLGDSSSSSSSGSSGTSSSADNATAVADDSTPSATVAAGKSAADAADIANATAAFANSTSLPYWKPSLHVQLVADWSSYQPRGMPPHMVSALHVVPAPMPWRGGKPGVAPVGAGIPAGGAGYFPATYVNEFWLMSSDWVPLNASTEALPLTVSFSHSSLLVWSTQAQMQLSWSLQEAIGGGGEADNDMIKSILMDTNPILLAITTIVSVLHMVFEVLAFKNDVQFWRQRKNMEGLSLRSIGVNVVYQGIVLAYLWDNDTAWMILASSSVGFLIEVWKLSKAFVVGITWRGWVPRLRVAEKSADEDGGYTRSRTKEYDQIAVTTMLLVLLPLVVGYSLYSLAYHQHRSWLSWLLGSLVGAMYAFGFINMTPQLFINYKHKSVAAMPWRAMSYKFLSTFIDDLFAFVVKMPTLHRLAVFRDDLIFFIYLYQRWIYPVDKTRVNEFGFSGEDAEAAAAGKRPPGAAGPAAGAAPRVAATAAGSAALLNTPAAAAPAPRRSKFDRAPEPAAAK